MCFGSNHLSPRALRAPEDCLKMQAKTRAGGAKAVADDTLPTPPPQHAAAAAAIAAARANPGVFDLWELKLMDNVGEFFRADLHCGSQSRLLFFNPVRTQELCCWCVAAVVLIFMKCVIWDGGESMGSGGKMRDGRPPLPVSVGAQMKEDGDGEAANGGDDGEASEAVKNHLKQQVLALTTQVEEVWAFINPNPLVACFSQFVLRVMLTRFAVPTNEK